MLVGISFILKIPQSHKQNLFKIINYWKKWVYWRLYSTISWRLVLAS